MFKYKKSQKVLSSLIAMTFAFTIPIYGISSMSFLNKAVAKSIVEVQEGNYLKYIDQDTGKIVDIVKNPIIDEDGNLVGGESANFGEYATGDNTTTQQEDAIKQGKIASDNALIATGIDLIGGGIPISSNVRYAYMSSDGYSGRAISVCLPGNSEARHVAVNDEAKYNCYTWVSGGVAIPPMTTISVSPKKSGKGSEQVTVPYMWWKKVPDGNGGYKNVKQTGRQTIVLSYNAYEAKTTMEDSMIGSSINPVDIASLTGSDSSYGDISTGGGSSLCADGTMFCYDSNDINLPSDNTELEPNGGTSGPGYSSSGTNSGGSSSGSGTSYSDLLNDLLNDSGNSYNSGDSDWAKSNNGDGSGNLDEYFNGLSDDEGLPTGLTDDVLGVDGDLDSLGLNGEDTDGDGVLDTFTDGAGNVMDAEEASAYLENLQNGGEDDYSGYYSGDADDTEGGFGQSFSDFLSQFGIDGLGDGSLGSLTDENGNDTLAKRIADFVSGKTGVETGDKSTITEQELYDLAKKMLLANGMSLDDIKKGKNYDKNSAYTEPAVAWNMNRITTLLKDKKIKLESKDDIKKEKNNNVLTNASEKDKQIKSANDKKNETNNKK